VCGSLHEYVTIALQMVQSYVAMNRSHQWVVIWLNEQRQQSTSMAARLLYRSLASTLRDQARSLEFGGTSWPRRPGLQGLAAAGLLIDLGERTTAALEWEDLLQRSELRKSPFCFLRPFFAETGELAWSRIEREYPVLAALGVSDAIDRGFAALRQASSHAELLERLQPHDPGPPTRKYRPAHLLFACGYVCIHRFFGRCVVVGWDETCPQSEEWVVSNRIRESLKFGTEQPFYHVLLERDEIPRCCSEENLALDSEDPSVFAHPHASFYFQGMQRAQTFVPSAALSWAYPEDLHARTSSAERNYRSLADAYAGLDYNQ